MNTTPTLLLAALFSTGRTELITRYSTRLQAHHLRAMNAITACRTGALRHVFWRCPEHNDEARTTPRSCGHRSCPQLKAELGQCAVLHTHNRRLDLHPHVHIITPGGGIDESANSGKSSKTNTCF